MNTVKKYVVVSIEKISGGIANLITAPELFTREAAEDFVQRMTVHAPGQRFIIQEVGQA